MDRRPAAYETETDGEDEYDHANKTDVGEGQVDVRLDEGEVDVGGQGVLSGANVDCGHGCGQ